MSKEQNRNIRLGFFVILGILVFIAGIFMIGSKQDMFTKTIRISATFTNATGLKPGDYVRYNGVKVGVVENVLLQNDSLVKVDMQIEEKKRSFIHKDAVAHIASDGLMGDKIINIIAGAGNQPIVDNNDLIRGSSPINFDKVSETLESTNDNVSVITSNLKKLSGELAGSKGSIQALLTDSMMAINLRQSFSNLSAITAKLNNFSETLRQIGDDIRQGNNSVGKLLADTALTSNLFHASDKIRIASDDLAAATGHLESAMVKIDSGKGTVNTLITDSLFATDLKQSLLNIKSATKKIDDDAEALQHTWLLRGYFRKEAKKK